MAASERSSDVGPSTAFWGADYLLWQRNASMQDALGVKDLQCLSMFVFYLKEGKVA
jgi:hypothetical protein